MSKSADEQRYNKLGDTLRASGNLEEAIRAYEQGLIASPNSVTLHVSLGNVLLASPEGKSGATASYRRALALQPRHREARIRLAHVLKLSADYGTATDLLRELAADYPNDPVVSKEFGRLHFAQNQLDAARECFHEVIRLSPRDADAHHWLANIEHLRGNAQGAYEHYRRTIELKPLMRIAAVKSPAAFSVLLLFSPGNANTPHETLIRGAEYDSYFLLLVPGVAYDVDALRATAQVVVNLISDVDQGRDILPEAEALVELLCLPVVNHPRAIRKTDRESVAARLCGIPLCCVPQVRRFAAETFAAEPGLAEAQFPALVRVVGTHGGETFEKVDNVAAIHAFVAHYPGAGFYLTEFVDYRSADGFFRKYRFFFIEDEILPYHLAIDDVWKVHHVTTDMAAQPWMRHEEEAFLQDPAVVFEPRHFTALRAIREIIGLDFFGIDCAIAQNGELVVFEVNASMLVHERNERFPYKAPAVDRIKRAFDAMLRKKALR